MLLDISIQENAGQKGINAARHYRLWEPGEEREIEPGWVGENRFNELVLHVREGSESGD